MTISAVCTAYSLVIASFSLVFETYVMTGEGVSCFKTDTAGHHRSKLTLGSSYSGLGTRSVPVLVDILYVWETAGRFT